MSTLDKRGPLETWMVLRPNDDLIQTAQPYLPQGSFELCHRPTPARCGTRLIE